MRRLPLRRQLLTHLRTQLHSCQRSETSYSKPERQSRQSRRLQAILLQSLWPSPSQWILHRKVRQRTQSHGKASDLQTTLKRGGANRRDKQRGRWEPVKNTQKQQQDTPQPTAATAQEVARQSSPARDEAAARLQELLSSDSAFSTSFAFSRWRESVAQEDTPANDATDSAKDTPLAHESTPPKSSEHAAYQESPQESPSNEAKAPPAEPVATSTHAQQTRIEVPVPTAAAPFMPHYMPFTPYEMPPFLGAMMPRGDSTTPPPPAPGFHPPMLEPWAMMGPFRHPAMSPPPMGPYGAPVWDMHQFNEAHMHEQQGKPMHPDMHQFAHPGPYMMPPFIPYAMPPPHFMHMPYGNMYQPSPYPYPPRVPTDAPVASPRADMAGNPELFTQAEQFKMQPAPVMNGSAEAHIVADDSPSIEEGLQEQPPAEPEEVEPVQPAQQAPAEEKAEAAVIAEPSPESPQTPASAEPLAPIEVVSVPIPAAAAATAPVSDLASMRADGQSLLRMLKGGPSKVDQPDAASVEMAPAIPKASEPAVQAEAKESKPEAEKAATTKVQPPRRTVKNKQGSLTVLLNGKRAPEGVAVRPQGKMSVRWHLPAAIAQDPTKKFVIGLHRVGVSSNSNHIVTKPLNEYDMNTHEQTMFGEVPFRAPRSPGVFVYRLFDSDNDADTLAASSLYTVTISDSDVVPGLRYVWQLLSNKPENMRTGFNQLQQPLKLVRQPIDNAATRNILRDCLNAAIDAAEAAAVKLHDASTAFAAADTNADGYKDLTSEYYETEGKASKLHAQVYDVLAAAVNNPEVWSLVDDAVKQRADAFLQRYCPLLQILYISRDVMNEQRVKTLGFIPALFSRLTGRPSIVTATLSRAIDEMLPSLLPSADFFSRREGVRLRIMQALESSGLVPKNTQLIVFGSSANNFGTDGSDLDMCLRHPQGVSPPEDKGKFIEDLAQLLTRIGMTEVVCRSTARIPIVIFREPTTGLECDISLHNALAVRNTQLLNSYSRIDPRVRALAYVIKHWAKARHINSPPHGTLSSYGYIMCLIHFLQTRQPPILPNLQRLPPDWQGQDIPPNAVVSVPKLSVTHPVDGVECDTYFYVPAEHNFTTLNAFAARNTQSVGELLMEFFGYFAWQFDYKESVVSIRAGRRIPKSMKGEYDGWQLNGRLSVEDPFEPWYDVAHPVKERGNKFIRKEFVRAYTLCLKASGWDDGRNEPLAFQMLLAKICEIGEMPAFMRNADEKEEDEENNEGVTEETNDTVIPKSTVQSPSIEAKLPASEPSVAAESQITPEAATPAETEASVAAPRSRAPRGRGRNWKKA